METRRITAALATAAAALALTATPALAKGGGSGGGGGGGGGKTTAPAPTPTPDPVFFDPWTLCPSYPNLSFSLPDGSNVFDNTVADGACIEVRNAGGVLTLYAIGLAPGWTDEVQSAGGGSQNKVDVLFFSPTGDKHEAVIQPGKTVIK